MGSRAEEVVERVAQRSAECYSPKISGVDYESHRDLFDGQARFFVRALVTELGITAGMVAYHRQLAHEYREEGAEHNAGAQTLTANALSTLLEIAEP